MKAVSYLRVSGNSQLEGDGFTRQAETIALAAHALGYELIREYREQAICGELDEKERPTFKDMVQTLLGNGCRTVFVERLDRLARAYRIQEHLLIYLASKGIAVISADTKENVTDSIMGDPMRKALVQMQGIFAELDKNMLVAKLRKARERKRNSGQPCEGKKPFGHSNYPQELPILNRILELSEETQSLTQIAIKLKDEGLSTRSGKPWSHVTLLRIIRRAA